MTISWWGSFSSPPPSSRKVLFTFQIQIRCPLLREDHSKPLTSTHTSISCFLLCVPLMFPSCLQSGWSSFGGRTVSFLLWGPTHNCDSQGLVEWANSLAEVISHEGLWDEREELVRTQSFFATWNDSMAVTKRKTNVMTEAVTEQDPPPPALVCSKALAS